MTGPSGPVQLAVGPKTFPVGSPSHLTRDRTAPGSAVMASDNFHVHSSQIRVADSNTLVRLYRRAREASGRADTQLARDDAGRSAKQIARELLSRGVRV